MPGWHPFIIHFPIAVLPLSVIVDIVAAATSRRQLHTVAYALLLLGTVTAAAAVISGNSGAAPYREVASVADLVEEHEDSGTITLVIFLVTALGRLPLQLRENSSRRLWLAIAVALLGCAMLWRTSLLGGELVYDHGVGVFTPSALGQGLPP